MHFSAVAAGLVAVLAVSVSADNAHHARHPTPVKRGPAFPELQARYDPVAANVRPASRTRRNAAHNVQNVAQNKQAWTLVRASGVLQSFHSSLNQHAGKIRSLCSQADSGAHDEQYFVNLSLELKAELDAVISITAGGHDGIANCGSGPVASGSPTTPPPSGGDLCQIIIQIIAIFQACISVTIRLCATNRIVRGACADSLQQISSHLVGFITSAHTVLSMDVIGQVGRATPWFNLNGYGWNQATSLLS